MSWDLAKLRLLVAVFSSVTLFGCQTLFGPNTTSEWQALQEASSMDCDPWPVTDRDLEVRGLSAFTGSRPGMLATVMSRTGRPAHYYAPFTGDTDIDRDDLVALPIGASSVIVGGRSEGGVPFAAVVRNRAEKSRLEVRNTVANVVVFEQDLLSQPVVEGNLFSPDAGNHSWLRLRQDDNGVRVAHLGVQPGGKFNGKVVDGLSFPDYPVIIPAAENKTVLLWARDGSNKIKVQTVDAKGVPSKSADLDVPIRSDLESWSAYPYRDGFFLAVIDGDSLVGQATLRVGRYTVAHGSVELAWTRELAVSDVHVTEPVFVSHEDDIEIMMMNWVDEESTIARYQVAEGELNGPAYSGVFPKGARIAQAFEYDGDLFSILRFRDNGRWAFEVCEF